jgi:type II secretory pathway component PulC
MSGIETAGTGVLSVLTRLPLSWRGTGAVVIGILLARWTWIIFAPNAMSVFPALSEASGNASEMLFGMPAPGGAVNSNLNAKLGNVQLMGVFTGKKGFAVLRLDEKTQRGVALGDEVISGTRLVEVDADHVVLEYEGVRQQVNLEIKTAKNKENQSMAQTSSAPAVAQAMAGWNQANEALQNDRSHQRISKMKEAH